MVIGQHIETAAVRPTQADYEAARLKLIERAGGENKIARLKLIEAWDPMNKKKIWRLDAWLN